MDEEVSALIDELVGKITRILTTKGLHIEEIHLAYVSGGMIDRLPDGHGHIEDRRGE